MTGRGSSRSMSPVKKKMLFLRSGTTIVRSPIRKQKTVLPTEQEPLLTPLRAKKRTKKPVPVETASSVKPLKGSKKCKAKKPRHMDGHWDEEAGEADGTAVKEIGADLTEDQKFWALGLGEVILKEKGALNKQTVRDVLLSFLRSGDSLPPSLKQRRPTRSDYDEDDEPIEEQPEWMTILHTVILYLIRKFLTDYSVPLPVFKDPALHLALTALLVSAKSVLFGTRTFHDVIALLKLVEANCDSLTTNLGSRVQDRARSYVSRMLSDFKDTLNSTLLTLRHHEDLVESCVHGFLVRVRCASALGLDLHALMKVELDRALTDWDTHVRARTFKAAVTADSLRAASQATAALQYPKGYQPAHAHFQPPPPPGLGYSTYPRSNAPATGIRPVLSHLSILLLVG